jgi:arsenate reductase|tara:strand:- start:733 stop:1089 length:357 start_codon:yes stop_codon:yes gene_type:complete
MKAFYYLKTCSTCKRIMSDLNLGLITQIDLKSTKISEKEINLLKDLSGSYESLFNKRSQLFKKRNLKNKNLSEQDYKNLILEHYTFMRRPILIYGKRIFIGNDKKNIDSLKKFLDGEI